MRFGLFFSPRIPTGFRPLAQGCISYPGNRAISVFNPKGVASVAVVGRFPRSGRNPLGVVSLSFKYPRVVQPLAVQPWAD